MVFKRCLKIAPRLSGSPMGVPLVPATLLRAEEHLLAAETAKSVVLCGGLLFVLLVYREKVLNIGTRGEVYR